MGASRSRDVLRRCAAPAAAALAAALALSTPADAKLTMTVGVNPTTLDFPSTARLVFNVTMTASDRDESFAFGFDTPSFGHDGARPIEGSPLIYRGEGLALSGGTVLGPARIVQGISACSTSVPAHGSDVELRRWDVLIPDGSTATATLPFDVFRQAPWPDTSYQPTFVAEPTLVSRGTGTLEQRIRRVAPAVRIAGRRGVHLRLHSTPSTSPAGQRGVAVVHPDQVVSIRGTTAPKLKRRVVRLVVEGPEPRTVAVHTDRRGRFAARLRLSRRGTWAIHARYHSTSRALADDYGCALGFVVR